MYGTMLYLEVLAEGSGIAYGLSDILFSYYLGGPKIVLKLPAKDSEWKRGYFFVSPRTIFGYDTDLPTAFAKPVSFLSILVFCVRLMFLLAD